MSMQTRRYTTLLVAALLILGCHSALAQLRIVGSISGSVHDPSGAVVPAAKIELKDEGTGITRQFNATSEGTFTIPDLAHGMYAITITADGFQQSVVNHIEVVASQNTDVPVSLRIGQTTESVVVEGVAPVLEATSNLTNSVTTMKLVNELPTSNRTGLDLAQFVPGFTGGQRINNVAGGAMNVTVDGINDASNGWKSGGTVWYQTVPIRLGALEEVTVESGGLGADSGAEGGVNVKFITKRGTNQYHGSGFYQPYSEQFNANTFSNNAQRIVRAKSRRDEMGGNIGGRMVPFGYLKDKLFFFLNWEDSWRPANSVTQTGVMTPEAQQGIYRYLLNGTTNQYATVNVMTIAAAAGYSTKLDPIVQSYIAMNNKIPQYGFQVQNADLGANYYQWTWTHNVNYYYPAARVDYYLTAKNQLSVAWNYIHEWDPGTQRFPWSDSKLTGPYRVGYWVWSAGVQSTITNTTFNEFRYGVQHSGDSNASATANYGTYNVNGSSPLRLGGSLAWGTMTPYIDQPNTTGRHFITTIFDTLTHIHGQHTLRAGFNLRITDWKDLNEVFPSATYSNGTPSGDPIPGTLFTTQTVPGIATSSLPTNPAYLYNELVGRVGSAYYKTVVNPDTKQYGNFIQYNWSRSYMGGLWAQDSWRVNPNLTVNLGVRWEAQGDIYDVIGMSPTPKMRDIYGPSTSLFTPGQMSGNTDPTGTIGIHAYKPDWLNFSPNAGIAWNPQVQSAFLRKLTGGSKTVIRANWSMSYYDEGTLMYSGSYGCGPGTGIGCNAGKQATQTLQAGTSTALPQWTTISDVANNPLTATAFTGITPYSPVLHQNLNTFSSSWAGMKPTVVAPYMEQWNFGIQREIAHATVLEVKYVGNQTHHQWRTVNLNEVNVFENGFLSEFQTAQNNLAIANGVTVAQLTAIPQGTTQFVLKSNNFANQGLPGQKDLPIMSAAFGARGTVPAIAATSGFNSATFAGYLQNGAVGSLASSLTGQNYFCRMMGSSFSPCMNPGIASTGQSYNAPGAGYPINFFTVNPYTTSMNYVDDPGWYDYNGLQVQLRKSFSHHVLGTFNYSWAHGMSNIGSGADSATLQQNWLTLRNPALDRRPSPYDQRHTISAYESYDLPIGKGRFINLKNRILDSAIGGWTASSTFTFNTGSPNQLGGAFSTFDAFPGGTNQAAYGVTLAPGVTLNEVSDAFHGQPLGKVNQVGNADGRVNRGSTNDWTRLAIPLDWLNPDGRANPKYFTFNNTPGSMGQILYIYGKNSFNWNAAMTKTFKVTERVRLSVYAEANNIMNHPSWGMGSLSTNNTGFGTIGAPSGNRSMTFRGNLAF
jgi:hypothetical protein